MKLKSIILFNIRDESFSVVGFNYTEEEAAREVDKLRKENLPAYTLEQDCKYDSEKEVEDLVNRKMSEIKSKSKK